MSFKKGLILMWAVLLDILGWLCAILDFAFIGNALSVLLDAAGIITIGVWALSKGRSPTKTPAKSLTKLKPKVPEKTLSKVIGKLGLATFSELIPIWGDLCPSWTIFVITTKE